MLEINNAQCWVIVNLKDFQIFSLPVSLHVRKGAAVKKSSH